MRVTTALDTRSRVALSVRCASSAPSSSHLSSRRSCCHDRLASLLVSVPACLCLLDGVHRRATGVVWREQLFLLACDVLCLFLSLSDIPPLCCICHAVACSAANLALLAPSLRLVAPFVTVKLLAASRAAVRSGGGARCTHGRCPAGFVPLITSSSPLHRCPGRMSVVERRHVFASPPFSRPAAM